MTAGKPRHFLDVCAPAPATTTTHSPRLASPALPSLDLKQSVQSFVLIPAPPLPHSPPDMNPTPRLLSTSPPVASRSSARAALTANEGVRRMTLRQTQL
ncbi:hypothetical protein MPTK1_3g00290 [Marchantia polymorpha subsp. ruderalis]|uniref:Uncharacterized protein n=2 Tax=Marchantia polymorpha TaxID=3197 RepID=A0AAF6AVU8_MARPO|nr:hypothetical protein MARPO_0007s0026 [Marchantia polymorpha]BBN03882.1 hypothetical protein Mp_3g00290 [Marchantia polymorpha subsp. ruderalis]|eukprot:PTQ47571.1 hypothetical protein MARPO_0007s0026 [Marchantia polymorpha]